MADNDILYKDSSATPQSFYPEASDQGGSVRRTMVGVKDGADLAQGAKADAAYADATLAAAGSLVALLKGVYGRLVALTRGAAFTSRSATTLASTSTVLMPANAARRSVKIQAPTGADLWINELGGTASAGGADCFVIPAGRLYEPYTASTAAVTYFCATAGLQITAMEG